MSLFSLAELSSPVRKHQRKTYGPKTCIHCKANWTPKTGKAAAMRLYCYQPFCEDEREKRHVEQIKARAARLREEAKATRNSPRRKARKNAVIDLNARS